MTSRLFTLAASVLLVSSAHAADSIYSSEGGAATSTPNAAAPTAQYTHFLETVTVASATPVDVTGLEVSVHFNTYTPPSADSQDIYAFIYTGGNAATGDLSGSTFLGSGAINIVSPSIGNRTPSNDYFYTFSLTPDIGKSLTFAPGTQIQVEFALTLANALDQFANSDQLVGNFSTGINSIANPGNNLGVFANQDNNTPFTAANAVASTAIRFALVPEPSSLAFSAIAGCLLLGTVIRARGSRIAA